MTWIKQNYGKTALLAVSVAAAGVSVWLILQSNSFSEAFSGVQSGGARSAKLPPLPFDAIDQGLAALASPSKWSESKGASLFVSDPYLVQEADGQQILVNPLSEDSKPIHPPVPNKWFQENELEILSPNILAEDTDNDGFTNREEWEYKTNPRDPASTPPAHLLLTLAAEEKKPVRLIFQTVLGDLYQVRSLDTRPPTQSVPIGEPLKGTKFKVVGFTEKIEKRDIGGSEIEKDVSELVIEDTSGSGEKITLVKDVVTDVGDSVAILKPRGAGEEIRVKRNGEFSFRGRSYRLAGTSVEGASLTDTATGQQVLVPRAAATEPSPNPPF